MLQQVWGCFTEKSEKRTHIQGGSQVFCQNEIFLRGLLVRCRRFGFLLKRLSLFCFSDSQLNKLKDGPQNPSVHWRPPQWRVVRISIRRQRGSNSTEWLKNNSGTIWASSHLFNFPFHFFFQRTEPSFLFSLAGLWGFLVIAGHQEKLW